MMTFQQLYDYSKRIRNEASRNGKIEIIKDYLKRLNPGEAYYGVHYISGKVPQGRMSLARKGLAALLRLPGKKRKSVSLEEVNRIMERVKAARGRVKYVTLTPLFESLTKEERGYFLSLLFGEAQQGAGEGLVIQAISGVFALSVDEMDKAYLHDPDLGRLFVRLQAEGKTAVSKAGITIFRPVKPMLAQVSGSIDDALADFDEAAIEYKLDGVRIQVHKDGNEIRVFSRNLQDRTVHFPELVMTVRNMPAKRFIADGEAIALDPGGKIVPFQVLARRTTRKRDIEGIMKDIPVRPQFFDILYLDNQDLTSLPYRERHRILTSCVPNAGYRAVRSVPESTRAARDFYERSVESGNEGVVIKGLQSAYHPGKRGKHWFKVKRTYTVDCVILAAEWGYGKRQGRLSNIHLGILDETRTKYLMVGKTFKGLTDEMLQWMTDTLPGYKVHEDKWTVYVRPAVVVEIAFNEVQTSPRYDSGVSLRFARVKRFRTDKDADDINTIIDLERIRSTT